MNARKIALMAAVLSVGLFTLEESALAENDCKQVKGQQVGVLDEVTNTTSGTVSKGGWLNGTYVAVFSGGALPTPDPTTISFTSDFTITTNHGELKASNVYLFNFAGVGAVLGRINPTTSTGRFAGATGVLYFAAKVTSFSPFTVEEGIAGEICFAK
jgi:hypothetical protein